MKYENLFPIIDYDRFHYILSTKTRKDSHAQLQLGRGNKESNTTRTWSRRVHDLAAPRTVEKAQQCTKAQRGSSASILRRTLLERKLERETLTSRKPPQRRTLECHSVMTLELVEFRRWQPHIFHSINVAAANLKETHEDWWVKLGEAAWIHTQVHQRTTLRLLSEILKLY